MFNAIVTLGARLATFLFVITGVMLTYEVIARYFFIRPTIWAAELSQLCLIWGSLLALAWVLRERRHIAVDAVFNLLSDRLARLSEIFAMSVLVVFSVIVVWKGADIFYDSWERGRATGSLLNLPAWLAELSVPVGFFLFGIQSMIELVRVIRGEPVYRSDGVPRE